MIYFSKHTYKPIGTRLDGEYEANILCQKCENDLGKLDEYAAQIIHGLGLKEKLYFREHVFREILFNVLMAEDGYDYTKFKLFLLSVVWRASISSRPFFSNFKLDKDIEEDLRVSILGQEPQEERSYPCLITLPPLVQNEQGEKGFRTEDILFTSNIRPLKNNSYGHHFFILGTHYTFLATKDQAIPFFCSIKKDRLALPFRTLEKQNEIWKGISQTINSNDINSDIHS